MPAEIWKDRDVARAFLDERSLLIPDRQRQLEVVMRIIHFTCPHAKRILDLGCGDGILLAAVLETFPQTEGVAVDFSPLMLENARTRFAKFPNRTTLLEGDLGTPAWKNAITGTFDVVVSGFAIHHLVHERKRALYSEIFNVLNAGGVFLNSEHVASSTPRLEQVYDEAMTEHLWQRRAEKGEKVTLEQVRRDFMERPDRAANILALVEDQCQWLRAVGFRDVDCFWKYFELAVFGGTK